MRVKLGLMCFNADKQFVPSFEVFRQGQPVTYMGSLPNGVLQVNGDLAGWNSYERNASCRRLDKRFLGVYLDGLTEGLPNQTIICEDEPVLEDPDKSAFVMVDVANKTIQLSKFGSQQIPLQKLKSSKSVLTNQCVLEESPSLICADLIDLQPARKFTRVVCNITGEGRQKPLVYTGKINECEFWPTTRFVQVALYTNWFGHVQRLEKGQLIWRNVTLEEL